MVVGKTSSSITKSEIFNKFSEASVLQAVFPEVTKLPCLIKSPLRHDEKPSFSLYISNGGHIYYKDHATNDRGSMLDLMCQYWDCTFNQALEKISKLLIKKGGVTIKPTQIKTLTRKESDAFTQIKVVVRPWRDYDYEYWASYGIEKKWLKYADVYPISYKIVYKKEKLEDKWKKYVFPAPKYTFCYVERKEGKLSLKIYAPFSKTHKWCSKMDASVISLWEKVPEYGDKIIIASSVKDALVISSNLHIPAIALQGEGYNMSQSAINELKRRYKKVYISFDGDIAGILDSQNLSAKTGFDIIPCPILDTPREDNENVNNLIEKGLEKCDKAKDWSDIYLYFGKNMFIEEFNKSLNSINGRSLERDTRV